MIKFKQGSVTNPKTGVVEDIVVKAVTPNNLKDILIGGLIVVGGITYLTITAFRNGAKNFEVAEFNALGEAGLLGDGWTKDFIKSNP